VVLIDYGSGLGFTDVFKERNKVIIFGFWLWKKSFIINYIVLKLNVLALVNEKELLKGQRVLGFGRGLY
jgi:hypothetical protein